MRHFIHIIIFLLFSFRAVPVLAQSARDRVEALRMEFINKNVEITPSEAEKFWPVYNEYNEKLRAVRKNLRLSYKRRSENLSDQEAEQLYILFIQSKQAEAEIHKVYNERLRGIIGAKKMVKLHVAEEEFRVKVMKSIKGEGD